MLNPPGCTEQEAIKARKQNVNITSSPLTAFAMPYRPCRWWWEPYTLVRRLVLTSASLVFDTLASVTVFVLTASIVFLIIEREAEAFINGYVSAFTCTLGLLDACFPLGPR